MSQKLNDSQKIESIKISVRFPKSLKNKKFDLSIPVVVGHNYGHDIFNVLVGTIRQYSLLIAKGYFYEGSWKADGELMGCAANIRRKHHRVFNCWQQQQNGKLMSHYPKLDGSGDEIGYLLIYLFDFLHDNYPSEFKKWSASVDSEIKEYLDVCQKIR